MKYIFTPFATTSLLSLSIATSHGAVVAIPDLVATVISTGADTDSNSDPLIDLRNLINGQVRGTATSSAGALDLDIPQPDDFSITGSALSAELARSSNGGSLPSSATSTYQITFAVATGETGNLSVNFSYALQNLGIPSQLSWSLTGPDVNVSSVAGGFDTSTGAATQSGNVSQTTTLSTAGTYTFTVTATTSTTSIPNDAGLKSSSGITGFSLDYVKTIPEPSSAALLLLSSISLLRHRRRA